MRSNEVMCDNCDGAGMVADSRKSLRVSVCMICKGHGKRPIWKEKASGFEKVLAGDYAMSDAAKDIAVRI